MPTKTDRILSYLPSSFSAYPRPPTLYTLVDAFGSELLKAENSLAALMLAHWVDHADKGADLISDLACIASLYGLAPRSVLPPGSSQDSQSAQPLAGQASQTTCPPQVDSLEGIEEFRDHLKRYVLTFIDGTMTVQGILRITAEALGLHIDDEYAQMDTWWSRPSDALASTMPRSDDAAEQLFGVPVAYVSGQASRQASVTGQVGLRGGKDVRGASTLRIRLDGAKMVAVDLSKGVSNPAAVTLDEIKKRVNQVLRAGVAGSEGPYLTLASPTFGAGSELELQEGNGDAAPGLLGLAPLTYRGARAVPARVTNMNDLSSGIVDLSANRYLRIQIDGQRLEEVDCAGKVPAQTTLAEVAQAINDAFVESIASQDGHSLTLTSTTSGFRSSIAFQSAAAQDALATLFGAVPTFTAGVDALAARAIGVDLGQGVDLSKQAQVRIQVDNRPPVTVNCAGANPPQTSPDEIVSKLNAAFGAPIASLSGNAIRLTSSKTGTASAFIFQPLADNEDATEIIFGIRPRVFHGSDAAPARLVGTKDLSGGFDLLSYRVVKVAIDGGTPVEIDLWNATSPADNVPLDKIVAALNAALGAGVATQDGKHLILVSPISGGASRIDLGPLEETTLRRFVTRANITDDAATPVFGFITKQAQGVAAAGAQVTGSVDLSLGTDVRQQRYLRISIDGQAPIEVDVAKNSPRPRLTSLDELVASINGFFPVVVASKNGPNLAFASPTKGSGSKITFEPARSADALDTLIGLDAGIVRGVGATRVTFTSTVDLSAGVDLSKASKIKLSIDGGEAKEIGCAGSNAAKTSLQEIVTAINIKFPELGGALANQDGKHILLISSKTGADSIIDFQVPSESDATKAIFGITARRTYQGSPATPATVTGVRDLSKPVDLSAAHYLVIASDGLPPVTVDFSVNITDLAHAKLQGTDGQDIIEAINKQASSKIASTPDGIHLVLTSANSGARAQLELQAYTGGDAFAALLGQDVQRETAGVDPTPAVITGTADLLSPVDLSERRLIRIALDGQRPLEMDVSGAGPENTSLPDIVAKINAVIPGLASATDDDHLRLISPTADEVSQLSLLPMRTLDVIEYPPVWMKDTPGKGSITSGQQWTEVNDGAAASDLTIDLCASRGVLAPTLVNLDAGLRLRLLTPLQSGDCVHIQTEAQTGISATIVSSNEQQTSLPGAGIQAGPPGSQASVPFKGEWELSGGTDSSPSTLQLNNPLVPQIVLLSARQPGSGGNRITVSVVDAEAPPPVNQPAQVLADGQSEELVGRLTTDTGGYRLANGAGQPDVTIARLLAGNGITFDVHINRVVAVYGRLYRSDSGSPLMVVTFISDLFHVEMKGASPDGKPVVEEYSLVSIDAGTGPNFSRSLLWQIMQRPSALVAAKAVEKGAILTLPRGSTTWQYLDGNGDRYDSAVFDTARFVSMYGAEQAILDSSRFIPNAPEQEVTVFAGLPTTDAPVTITFQWQCYQPGRFAVNLPDDLPDRFGSHFDQVRFGAEKDEAESYPGVVTEPDTDTSYLGTKMAASNLVDVRQVESPPPLGWDPVPIPFKHPRVFKLTGGTDAVPAQIYLSEEGASHLIELSAKQSGAWGNDIAVSVRRSQSGPAYFDVTVSYVGVVLENARLAVMGGSQPPPPDDDLTHQLSSTGSELLKPGPVGILQAKAAGIQANVTRDRT
jgi:hypothetical protein